MDPPPRCFSVVLFCLFLSGSIALFSVSVWVLIKYEAVQDLVASTPTLLEDSAFCGITAGSVAFITAIWGVCGIRRNNKLILSVSVAGLFMTACIEFVVFIMAFLFVGQFDQHYGSVAIASLNKHYRCTSAAAATVTTAWDELQTTNQCCGFYNGTDYVESFYDLTTSHLQPWPFSCCSTSESGNIVNMGTCLDSENISDTHASTGCQDYLSSMLTECGLAVGLVAFILFIVQIPLIITTVFSLRNYLKYKQDEEPVPPKPINIAMQKTSNANVYYDS